MTMESIDNKNPKTPGANLIDKARGVFIRAGYTLIGRYTWEYWSNGNKTFQIKDDSIVPLNGKPLPISEFLEQYDGKEVLG